MRGSEDIACYLCPARKKTQQAPCKGSMSGSEKKMPSGRGCRRQERREREKKARCRSDEDAGQSSAHDLSADPHGDEDDIKVEAGDDGDDEMQDPRDPRDRHRKEEEVTVNIPRHILGAPAVPEVAGWFLMSNNQVGPTITKRTKMYVTKYSYMIVGQRTAFSSRQGYSQVNIKPQVRHGP